MTAINFPPVGGMPTDGSFTYIFEGTTYAWDGAKWTAAVVTKGVTSSEAAPAVPVAGDLWFETGAGRLFIYYNDGDSAQWVEASPHNAGYAVGGTAGQVLAKTDSANFNTEWIDNWFADNGSNNPYRVHSNGNVSIELQSDNVTTKVLNGTCVHSSDDWELTSNASGKIAKIDSVGLSLRNPTGISRIQFFADGDYDRTFGSLADSDFAIRNTTDELDIIGSNTNAGDTTIARFRTNVIENKVPVYHMSDADPKWFKGDGSTGVMYLDVSENGRIFLRDNFYAGRFGSTYNSGEHGVYSYAGSSGSYTYIFGRNVADSSFVYHADVGTPRIEFRANGNGYFDGGADLGNADYAEMFEWSDGNPNNEDRRGCSVVLDGEKIRIATSADPASEIIGIVSVEPGVLGDSAALNWHGEWLRDEYGAKVQEDVEYLVWNAEGEEQPTTSTRYSPERRIRISELGTGTELDLSVPDFAKENDVRQIYQTLVPNPDYDPSMEYIARRNRKEWEAIGLMGKLPLLNTEPVGDRWIKLKKMTDDLDLWLVR